MYLGEYLELYEHKGDKVIRCRKCGHIFCSATENPKKYAHRNDGPLTKAGPVRGELYDQGRFILREYCCPRCGVLFDVEVALKGSPICMDMQLELGR